MHTQDTSPVLYSYRQRTILQVLGCLPRDKVLTDIEWIERHVHMKVDRIAIYGYLWHMHLKGWIRVQDTEEHRVAVSITQAGIDKLEASSFQVQVRAPR